MINSSLSIYQIYFNDEQLSLLDPHFIPYNNAHSSYPEQREFPVFKHLYENQEHKKTALLGAISWKFKEKSHIDGKTFIEFIRQNPGYDVYYINPFPHELYFHSVWEQAEHFHPGIIDMVQTVFDQLNYHINVREIKNLSLTAAYCNFWVGTESFWEVYMNFVLPVYQYIMQDASEEFRNKLFQPADRITDSVYFPFILERLFSTLLYINPHIKSIQYSYSEEELIKNYGLYPGKLLHAVIASDKLGYLDLRS